MGQVMAASRSRKGVLEEDFGGMREGVKDVQFIGQLGLILERIQTCTRQSYVCFRAYLHSILSSWCDDLEELYVKYLYSWNIECRGRRWYQTWLPLRHFRSLLLHIASHNFMHIFQGSGSYPVPDSVKRDYREGEALLVTT